MPHCNRGQPRLGKRIKKAIAHLSAMTDIPVDGVVTSKSAATPGASPATATAAAVRPDLFICFSFQGAGARRGGQGWFVGERRKGFLRVVLIGENVVVAAARVIRWGQRAV